MIREATIDRPFVRDAEQMQGILEQLEKRGYSLDRLDTLTQAADQKEELVTHLRDIDPSLNGNVDHLIEDLNLYKQEAASKKKWSLWGYVKEIPGRVWKTVKKHPKKTIALVVVAGLIAAGFYTGAIPYAITQAKAWLAAQGVWGAAEKAGEAASAGVEAAKDAAGRAIENLPKPPPAPTVPPMPTQVPGLDEAGRVLDALEKGGG